MIGRFFQLLGSPNDTDVGPVGKNYWTDAFPLEWNDYKVLWNEFLTRIPGVAGMTKDRMSKRAEPLRWPCPDVSHPGVSSLVLDRPSWHAAAESLGATKGRRFLTPTGKVEVFTPEPTNGWQPPGMWLFRCFIRTRKWPKSLRPFATKKRPSKTQSTRRRRTSVSRAESRRSNRSLPCRVRQFGCGYTRQGRRQRFCRRQCFQCVRPRRSRRSCDPESPR